MSNNNSAVALERRKLITYVLEEFRKNGGKVILPVGMDSFEDWLLDILNVDLLLTRVKARIHPLDLAKMCHQQQFVEIQSNGDQSSQDVVVSFDQLTRRQTDQSVNTNADESVKTGKSSVSIEIQGSDLLEDAEIGELCQIAFLMCMEEEQEEEYSVKEFVPEWLQASASRIDELDSAVQLCSIDRGKSIISMFLQFIQNLRPRHFNKIGVFHSYQRITLKFLIVTLVNSLEEVGQSRSGLGIQELRARLHGIWRRLQVTDFSDFHEHEYTDALQELEHILQMCGGGVENGNWNIPKGIQWKISIYLLNGLFDDIENNGFHREKDKLQDILQRQVWPALGISQELHGALLTWAYFTQFVGQDSASEELVGSLKGSLKKLQPNGEEMVGLVVTNVEKQVMLKLENYHDYGEDEDVDRNLRLHLNLLIQIQKSKNISQDQISQIIQHCIESSIESEVTEIWKNAKKEYYQKQSKSSPRQDSSSIDPGSIVANAAQQTLAMLQEEITKNSPIFEQYFENSKQAALIRAHKCFGSNYFVWLVQVETLDRDTLQGIRCVEQLEQFIIDRLKELNLDIQNSIKTWDTIKKILGLLITWTNTQNAKLLSWLKRLSEKENWNYVGKNEYYSTSAVEMCRMADEAATSLFNMGIGLPAAVVASLLEGINALVQQFVVDVMEKLPQRVEDCVPPRPGLTRYKQELAIKAVKADEKLHSNTTETEDKTSKEDAKISKLTQDVILCRLNSLQFVQQHLTSLKKEIMQHWGDLPWPAGSTQSPSQGWGADDLFPSAQQNLNNGINHINQFLAVKIVYWDVREAWLERLYRHRVGGNGVEEVGILVQLDSELGYVAGKVTDRLRDQFAELLLITVLGCLERVLLDGGPTRLFIPDDVRNLEADLMKIRGLFIAGGEGLPAKLVDQQISEVSKILSVMAIETPVVISNIGSPQQILNDQILIRILGHRADRAASKYLKKEYKLPKKTEEGTFSKFKNVFKR